MFFKFPRKATNDYRTVGALLAAFIACGAVAGTVLLTRAPGMSLAPKSVIMQALGFGTAENTRQPKNKVASTDDSTVQPSAGKQILDDQTKTSGASAANTGSANEIASDHFSRVRALAWTDAISNSPKADSTFSSGTIISPSNFASASNGALTGNTARSGSTSTSLQTLAPDADISWTGATSTAWGTATNWSPTGVPTGADNAVFNSTFSNQPTLTAPATVGGIWMADGVGQNVLISGSSVLTLNGNTIPQIGGTPNLGILVNNTNSFTLTISAPLKLNDNQGWTNSSGNLFTVSGAVDLNKNLLTVSGSGNTLISGIISSPQGALTKEGSGTLTVTGANSYDGPTTINGGTFLLNGDNSGAKGSIVANGNGTTLGGIGNTSSDVAVNLSANISPGDGVPSLHNTGILGTGALTLQAGTHFLVDINGETVGIQYDQLNVKGDATIANSHLVVYVGPSATITSGDIFKIIVNNSSSANATRIIGTFAEGSTVSSQNGYVFTILYDQGTHSNEVWLTLTEVPEPSTWIGGALAFVMLGYTQRRRLCSRKLSELARAANAFARGWML